MAIRNEILLAHIFSIVLFIISIIFSIFYSFKRYEYDTNNIIKHSNSKRHNIVFGG